MTGTTEDKELFNELANMDNINTADVMEELKQQQQKEEQEDQMGKEDNEDIDEDDEDDEDDADDDDDIDEEEDDKDDEDEKDDEDDKDSVTSDNSFRRDFKKKFSSKYKDTNTLREICRKEEKKQKAYLLAKLKTLSSYSKPVKTYTMNDSLRDLENEVNRIEREREMENSLSISRQGFMFCVSTLEFFSQKQKFVDVRLNGWSKKMMIDVNENKMYDGVFLELYEKHMNGMQLSPESRLLMMVLGSAFGFHMANKLTDMMFQKSQGQGQQNQTPAFSTPSPSSSTSRMTGPSVDLSDVLAKMRSRQQNRQPAAVVDQQQNDEIETDLEEILAAAAPDDETHVEAHGVVTEEAGEDMKVALQTEEAVDLRENEKPMEPTEETKDEAKNIKGKKRKQKPKTTLDLTIPDSFELDISGITKKKQRV